MVKLSLCVIVGKNESQELERLLKSVQGPLFDEIVVTTTQDDPAVKKIATQYSDKTPHFDWVKDFSAARNYCFNQATGEYLMWLDSDDEVSPENYKKLLDLKPSLQNYATVMISYNYGHHEDGTPSLVLPRERIVKNTPLFRWQDPIHEYIPIYANLAVLNRFDIAIDHRRHKEYSSDRNLEILAKVYSEGTASPRIKFYYGKDLMDSGKVDEALKVFNEYLAGPTDFDQNKAVACIRLGEHYMQNKDYQTAVMYMRRGLMFHQGYAEMYYTIGSYYREQRDFKEAVKYYHNATSKNPEGLFAAKPDFYKKFPLDALMQIYYNELKDYEKALNVCEEFLKYYPEDKNFLFNRVSCLNAIALSKGGTSSETGQTVETDLKPKIAWMIRTFDATEPSQRIRRLNVHVALQERGVDSVLITDFAVPPPEYTLEKLADRNIVVFSSFGTLERFLMEKLKARGTKVLFDLSEAILDIQEVRDTLKIADAVICCSKRLLEMARPYSKLLVKIEDAAEPTEKEYNYFLPVQDKPTALYIGMGGNSFLANEYLKSTLDKAGYKLVVCSEWDNADVKWSLDSWEDTMLSAHVIICPQRVEVQPAKSNIKVTQAMSMGIPVIASPLPAYTEIIKHGINGYLCETLDDWYNALMSLKSIQKRIQVGMNGKEDSGALSLPAIAQKWEQASTHILNKKATTAPKQEVVPVESKPIDMAIRQTVPVVIPVYNGVQYLKACISSIHMNTTYPYHIILSDAGSNEETWQYLRTLKGITVVGSPGVRRNFSEACNAGIAAAGSPRFIALLNSDVIVSKGWLEPIIQKMESVDRLAACGVLSNCDRGWLNGVPGKPSFPMRLEKAGMELVPGMKYDQVMPHLDELHEFMANSNKNLAGKYVSQPWVAAYATVFAKSALDDIGHFDPIFKNGCEDLDLCNRLRLMGYEIGQALDSFIYHFGGISRGAYQSEAREQYDAEDKYNHETMTAKWKKKNVIIYTGPAWEPWNREKVEEGMAGSETWAAELGAEFSKRGFAVTIFNEPVTDGEVDKDGVTYMHYSRLQEFLNYRYIDLTILSRTCEPPKQLRMHSNNIFCMVHDIWLSNDKAYNTCNWLIQKFAVLSEWHQDFFCGHHGIPKDKTVITFNGVNQTLYAEEVGNNTVKKNKTVYSSSPDRGLKQLLTMLPDIRAKVPDFEVDVAYGFYNWESAAKQRNNPKELAEIDSIKKLMEQPGVNYLGRINKAELARRQKEAKIWLFPTWFSETFCITAVENGLAGNALVTTPYAGLLTTLKDSAIYIDKEDEVDAVKWSSSEEYKTLMVEQAVKLLTDENYRLEWATKACNQVRNFTWGNAADQWLKLAKLV